MKTLMNKFIIALAAFALSLPAFAQEPQPERDAPEQFPQQFQQDGGTNGLSPEDVSELLQELLRTQEALRAAQAGENQSEKREDPRPIRGQGTRGTMGSGTNAQSLAALIKNPSANSSTNGAGALRLNFRNAPLSLVLDYLSDAAGFTISANSKVDLQGRVTVWSNQPVDRNEAIALLNNELTSKGYAATVEGNLLNIYVVDATTTPILTEIPGGSYSNIPPTKEMVTQIVYVHNVEANQLITSLQPLMPAGTSMNANQGANAIMITDTKANIRRMVQLVKALDTASVSASRVQVFALTYADATALAQVVTQLYQQDTSSQNRGRFPFFPGGFGGGDRGGRDNSGGSSGAQSGRMTAAKVTAVADERSNSLVVSGSDEQMKEIAKLVAEMDVLVDDVTELRVFRLRNADPQETADQLANLFPDPTTQQGSRSSSRGFFGGFRDRSSSGGNRSTDPNSRAIKQVRVTAVADPRTGSVIVSATRDLMNEIAGIIEELDSDPAKKKKVYVIKVENRDPADVVEELQGVIAADTTGGNFNSTRSSSRQSGSQLNTRQQNNLQNQGSSMNNNFLNNSSSRQRTGQ